MLDECDLNHVSFPTGPKKYTTNKHTSSRQTGIQAEAMTLMHSSRLAIGLSRSIKRGLTQAGDLGSGSGKGGGTGGSIRDAGGAFGKRQAEKEQLKSLQMQYKNLRKEMQREIEEHENRAREHNEAAERLRRRINELEKEEEQLKSQ
uniref:ATPase inhibitor, mitochondrial n=1 Tax=Setaria digitata TaxID=48799 RepID=A0A915PLK4_9BILA